MVDRPNHIYVRCLNEFLDSKFPTLRADPRKKVLIWIRTKSGPTSHRNTSPSLINDLIKAAIKAGVAPILIGDAVPSKKITGIQVKNLSECYDMTGFYNWVEDIPPPLKVRKRMFDSMQKQLLFFECLMTGFKIVGQVGVKSGGMDGPALIGLRTIVIDLEAIRGSGFASPG